MSNKFVCSSTEPIVQTKAGKIRGFIWNGTYTFHGIKYANAERFLPPTPVESWEGVKEATSYGNVCPMLQPESAVGELMVPHRYWPKSEHCQYLNVWSQSIDPSAKKPVMVWFHGGGFAAGSSIEQQAYDGENMSKRGDMVVVTINHRLNILGYLDLSPFGEKYKNSGNAGNADIVASLEWVRDNIAQFGGDPDNVTIFGQSGGGMKVTCMMQTPAAYGLFHKGIIQSGIADMGIFRTNGDATVMVNAILTELGLPENDIEALSAVPYDRIAEAHNKVVPELRKQGAYIGGNGPVANDWYVGDPLQVGFTEHAKSIPILAGTVLAEFAFGPGVRNKHNLTDAEIAALVSQRYGDKAEKLTELFKQAYPDKHLTDLLFVDAMFRPSTIKYVLDKAKSDAAPTYSYMFSFEFPFDDGKPAWHCSEIPFVFANTDMIPICNIPGVTEKLEAAMFGAWAAFAKTGNPNNPDLPVEWTPCAPGDEAVMIFDENCRMTHNHDHELIEIVKSVPPNMSGTVLH